MSKFERSLTSAKQVKLTFIHLKNTKISRFLKYDATRIQGNER